MAGSSQSNWQYPPIEIREHGAYFSPPTALDTTANPLYTSCKQKRILQSNEQEKYLASHGYREPGLLETGTSAVKEWAWELTSEPSVQTEIVVLVSERPPLPRTGYTIQMYPAMRDYLLLFEVDR